MDSRYQQNGYAAEFFEGQYGAFMTIRQGGKVVGEVAFGYGLDNDHGDKLVLVIKQFVTPAESRIVMTPPWVR